MKEDNWIQHRNTLKPQSALLVTVKLSTFVIIITWEFSETINRKEPTNCQENYSFSESAQLRKEENTIWMYKRLYFIIEYTLLMEIIFVDNLLSPTNLPHLLYVPNCTNIIIEIHKCQVSFSRNFTQFGVTGWLYIVALTSRWALAVSKIPHPLSQC